MNRNILLAVGIILLFVIVNIQPVIADDDTTPPVTIHTLNPPEPDGNNGWYVSDVNVTLTATDDISGVNTTHYRIDGGDWIEYSEPFTLSEDGDDIFIEYYSVDYADNIEDVKSFKVDIDQTLPDLYLSYEVLDYDELFGANVLWRAEAVDSISGMERVEFYYGNSLQETVYGNGPFYYWEIYFPHLLLMIGLICNREITNEYVKFNAIMVKVVSIDTWTPDFTAIAYDNARNSDDYVIFSSNPRNPIKATLSNQYITLDKYKIGYIGRFVIFGLFTHNYIKDEII